jgi:hypothetical protein
MNEPKCPRCSQALAAGVDEQSLTCGGCNGMYIAAGGVRASMLEEAEEIAPAAEASVGEVAITACPGCGKAMVPMRLADVEFERCGACQGVWLDAGEALGDSVELGRGSVGKFLLYTLSLPERTVRTTVGLAGGVAKEVAERVVPRTFQSSSTYRILVRNALNFLVEDVGGVASETEAEAAVPRIDNYVARKAVGDFVGMAGIATLRFSPVWILAVVSDVAYGSKAYLKELADELRAQGLIGEDSTIASVDDLLGALGHASGTTATMFDTPPLSVDDLRETTGAIRQAVTSIDPTRVLPQAEIRRMWEEMRDVAKQEDVGLFQVSSAMTLHALNKVADVGRGTFAGIRIAGHLLNRHILGHYTEALHDIRKKGFYATVREESGPYIDAVWNNFSSQKESVTEDVLSGRLMARTWRKVRGWFRRKPGEVPSAEATQTPSAEVDAPDDPPSRA